jgi:hypothetical protein
MQNALLNKPVITKPVVATVVLGNYLTKQHLLDALKRANKPLDMITHRHIMSDEFEITPFAELSVEERLVELAPEDLGITDLIETTRFFELAVENGFGLCSHDTAVVFHLRNERWFEFDYYYFASKPIGPMHTVLTVSDFQLGNSLGLLHLSESGVKGRTSPNIKYIFTEQKK